MRKANLAWRSLCAGVLPTNVAVPKPLPAATAPRRMPAGQKRSLLLAGGVLVCGLLILTVALVVVFGTGGVTAAARSQGVGRVLWPS